MHQNDPEEQWTDGAAASRDAGPTPGAEESAAAALVEPIPPIGLSKVNGLLELLAEHKGKEDIYKLARELRDSFGELLVIIKAAEILGFVETPGGDLVMLPLGYELIGLPVNGKKKLLGRRIGQLSLFLHFKRFLSARENQSATRQEMLAEIARVLPTERPKAQYDAMTNWGRYTEIFGYSRDEDRFYLVAPAASGGAEPGA